jgi:hypothetical protein
MLPLLSSLAGTTIERGPFAPPKPVPKNRLTTKISATYMGHAKQKMDGVVLFNSREYQYGLSTGSGTTIGAV